ncbi:cis-zeatin O-glucosyltransferase protein [Dioscorea alata]|uniref:Cis-zeatin O-glucosyltransferase protein n=2 Tax=Dioscorea alata TaxID=55571 RepID=A0ACB7WRC8_DIOAL|nr:cis-zeatin O-glucosyltransferase protein [Dioscorea alata]KAH7690883.1 cis-zeatin O-glucosyltransferase protein [Dioscorea alata]
MTSDTVVVVVPFVAQGHLNAFLHLSHRLSSHGLPVHYVSSTSHIHQVISRSTSTTSLSNIHFHHFPLPPYPSPPPTPTSPSTSTHFPSHLQPSFNASLHLKLPLTSLLHSLSSSSRRLILIHDSAMSFAATAAISISNVETYVFHTVAAITLSFLQWEARGKPPEPWVQSLNLPDLSFDSCFTDEFFNFFKFQHSLTSTASGRLINSSVSIEDIFLQHLRQEPNWQGQKWLDKQPPASVVYVAFGTTTSFSQEQVGEIKNGLVTSGQRFILMCRDADLGDIFAGGNSVEKCDEIEEVGGGVVVRGWAPQLEILSHPSMAAFMSHCGWNSCMESLSLGVPVLAWPMHSDQPWNAVLLTEILKVGILVREWKERNELVTKETVKDLVLKMVVGDEGKKMREKAAEIKDSLREAMSEAGASKIEFDSFIAHITRS